MGIHELTGARTASTVAKGISSGVDIRARRIDQRKTAKLRQAQMDEELQKIQLRQETGVIENEVGLLRQQTDDMRNKLTQQESFTVFDAYVADSNPNHINRLLQTNDHWRNLIEGIAGPITSFNRIDLMADREWLATKYKLSSEELNKLDMDNFQSRFLKATRPDGSVDMVDMANLYGSTGYAKYKSGEQRKAIADKLNLQKIAKGLGTGTIPTMQKNAARAAEAQTRIDKGEGTEEDRQFLRGWTAETAGKLPGRFDVARKTTDKLLKQFGGEDKFFGVDFGERSNFNKAYPYIAEIEALEGVEFTSREKTDLMDLRDLIGLSDPASQLTEKETGLFDTMLFKVRQYISDNVEGTESVVAYKAFRNTVQHALYGSALSLTEKKSMTESYGTLGQQLGPVLTHFKSALEQVKNKVETVALMKNPYSVKVRLGVDQVRLDTIIARIEERIEFITGLSTEAPGTELPGTETPEDLIAGAFGAAP